MQDPDDDASVPTDPEEPPGDPLFYFASGRQYAPLQDTPAVFVMLTRSSDPQSTFQLYAEKLPGAGTYRASVQRLPCSAADGGERYRIDPTQPFDAANTLTHEFTAQEDLTAHATWTIPIRPRRDAQSLVVEGPLPATARVACAGLAPEFGRDVWSGPLLPFREADDIDREITGTGSLRAGTIEIYVQGLRAERQYAPVVLYALPCQHALAPAAETGLDAIDHQAYRIDPTAAATGTNRIQLTPNHTGYAAVSTTPLLGLGVLYPRLDAQSLVLFRKQAQGADLPIACADLDHVGPHAPYVTYNPGGEPYVVEVELVRYAKRTKLYAELSYYKGAESKATFTLQGESCRGVGATPAPYLIDPAGAADQASNRIELEMLADGTKRSITVEHAVRVEAQSVRVLAPGWSPRCLDLW